jgi:hypothetical protein
MQLKLHVTEYYRKIRHISFYNYQYWVDVCLKLMGSDGEWEWYHSRDWCVLSQMMCVKQIFHVLWLSGPKNGNLLGDDAPNTWKQHLYICFVLSSKHLWHPSCSNFFVVEMLHNNFMHQQITFHMNFIYSKMPVCPDMLISPIFQVLSDVGQAPKSFIMNACPALVKHSTSLSHIWLTHYTFPIHCNKLTVNFNRMDTLCIQKPSYSSHFTIGGILNFLANF